MKVPISFKKQTEYVLACIKRGPKGNINYNSGLIYFVTEQMAQDFTKLVTKKDPDIEVKPISVLEAYPPQEGQKPKGYWCPYCQSWEYWLPDSGGYKRCPICRISHADYYVRKYNNLWSYNMKSKSAKKEIDKAGKRRK